MKDEWQKKDSINFNLIYYAFYHPLTVFRKIGVLTIFFVAAIACIQVSTVCATTTKPIVQSAMPKRLGEYAYARRGLKSPANSASPLKRTEIKPSVQILSSAMPKRLGEYAYARRGLKSPANSASPLKRTEKLHLSHYSVEFNRSFAAIKSHIELLSLLTKKIQGKSINSIKQLDKLKISVGFNRLELLARDFNPWRAVFSNRECFSRNASPLTCLQSNQKKSDSIAPNSQNWANPQLVRTLEEDIQGTVEAIAFTRDGQILVSGGGSQDPKIRLWDLQTWEKIRTLRGHQTRVLTLAIAPDSQTLVSGSDDSMLNIWNLKTGKLSHTFQKLATNFMSLAISPDGTILASGDLEGLKLWDLTKQRPLKTLIRFQSIYSVAISPDGFLLASGDRDATVKVWNLSSGELIGTLVGHKKPVTLMAFAPNSQILVTGSDDTTIKLWNVTTGELVNTLFGHPSEVTALAIHPDGQILASAGRDGMRIWDLRTGVMIGKFSGHSDWVRSLAFSPDGRFLASGGFDKQIKIWQAATSP